MNKFYGFVGLVPVAMAAHVQSAYAEKYMSVEQAQKAMFKNATSFVDSRIIYTKEQKERIEKVSGIKGVGDDQSVWKVFQNNKQIGYFIIDYVYGKHELIKYAVAIGNDGAVISTDIIEYKESYGGQVKQESWRKQFVGKKVSDKFVLDADVTNISGATLSCKHIADGVKRVLTIHDLYLKG